MIAHRDIGRRAYDAQAASYDGHTTLQGGNPERLLARLEGACAGLPAGALLDLGAGACLHDQYMAYVIARAPAPGAS